MGNNTSSPSKDFTILEAMNMEEALTCAVCLELYKHPLQLPCPHSFCRGCLQNIAPKTGSSVFNCPLCRGRIVLGVRGLSGLKKNIQLAQIVEIYKKNRARQIRENPATNYTPTTPIAEPSTDATYTELIPDPDPVQGATAPPLPVPRPVNQTPMPSFQELWNILSEGCDDSDIERLFNLVEEIMVSNTLNQAAVNATAVQEPRDMTDNPPGLPPRADRPAQPVPVNATAVQEPRDMTDNPPGLPPRADRPAQPVPGTSVEEIVPTYYAETNESENISENSGVTGLSGMHNDEVVRGTNTTETQADACPEPSQVNEQKPPPLPSIKGRLPLHVRLGNLSAVSEESSTSASSGTFFAEADPLSGNLPQFSSDDSVTSGYENMPTNDETSTDASGEQAVTSESPMTPVTALEEPESTNASSTVACSDTGATLMALSNSTKEFQSGDQIQPSVTKAQNINQRIIELQHRIVAQYESYRHFNGDREDNHPKLVHTQCLKQIPTNNMISGQQISTDQPGADSNTNQTLSGANLRNKEVWNLPPKRQVSLPECPLSNPVENTLSIITPTKPVRPAPPPPRPKPQVRPSDPGPELTHLLPKVAPRVAPKPKLMPRDTH
ncbi:uncharacterized protein LOC126824323 [Patella vulgata]|uniref:uncharacterized protein LOC126824323 n=1 Tax=Patella vulgata TaxID=6465 RepID=UPI00217F82FC|nr:uncharacterized protein LOC126824323 [Patella vulgata]